MKDTRTVREISLEDLEPGEGLLALVAGREGGSGSDRQESNGSNLEMRAKRCLEERT